MNRSIDVHQFALYYGSISQVVTNLQRSEFFELADLELIHRIVFVLRLEIGESVTLFDSNYNCSVNIIRINPKKSVTFELNSIEQNLRLTPNITWILPLLKKEAYEESLYSLTEMGVQTVQPVLTQKTSKPWFTTEKEAIRSNKIMIAAAEQSKQFIIPTIMPIVPLEILLIKIQNSLSTKIFFDANGESFSNVLKKLKENDRNDIIAFTGPEGDLTAQEKEMLLQQKFIFTRLTPTILRAQQAIVVGLGILRSLL